ncbi:MAG: ankyrin repeat domain-containing protein [Gammaproteobacteria bacterium]|nr:ankyrin repeat domain-containing protein [Gammaproteobacteria bacterium]
MPGIHSDTLFTTAFHEGNSERIIRFLITAIREGNTERAIRLVQSGVNINRASVDGETPLFLAALNGHIDIVKALLAAGADIEAMNIKGFTPLIAASSKGHTVIVETLLTAGADKNAMNKKGWIAIHCAAYGGYKKTVEALLASGTNIEAKTNDEWTAIHFAAYKGHKETVEALLATGADKNAMDKEGYTALIKAAALGYTDIVKILCDAGAYIDVDFKDKKGKTVFDYAKAHPAIHNLLIEAYPRQIAKLQAKHLEHAIIKGITSYKAENRTAFFNKTRVRIERTDETKALLLDRLTQLNSVARKYNLPLDNETIFAIKNGVTEGKFAQHHNIEQLAAELILHYLSTDARLIMKLTNGTLGYTALSNLCRDPEFIKGETYSFKAPSMRTKICTSIDKAPKAIAICKGSAEYNFELEKLNNDIKAIKDQTLEIEGSGTELDDYSKLTIGTTNLTLSPSAPVACSGAGSTALVEEARAAPRARADREAALTPATPVPATDILIRAPANITDRTIITPEVRPTAHAVQSATLDEENPSNESLLNSMPIVPTHHVFQRGLAVEVEESDSREPTAL